MQKDNREFVKMRRTRALELIKSFKEKIEKSGLEINTITSYNNLGENQFCTKDELNFYYYSEYYRDVEQGVGMRITDRKGTALVIPFVFVLRETTVMLTLNGDAMRDMTECFSIFNDNTAKFLQKSYVKLVSELFASGIVEIKINPSRDDQFWIKTYYDLQLRWKVNNVVRFEQIVDCRGDEKMVFSGIRQTYRNLISTNVDRFSISKYSDLPFERKEVMWTTFRRLHFVESGHRTTRSELTWDIQREMLNKGFAELYSLELENKTVGMSLVQNFAGTSLYSVAAYDRSRFDLPLGHVLQWAVLRDLLKKKIEFYSLGILEHMDKKKKDISLFKRGFGESRLYIYAKVEDI